MSEVAFFGELYLRSTRPFLSDAVSEREVECLDFALHRLDVTRDVPVLDLGAGHGRHAARLRRRGWRVVALEKDALSLSEREKGCDAAVQADFAALPLRTHSLGAVYAWYSTLFYGTDEENAALLRELHRALRPGGALLFQTVPHERLVRSPRARFRETLADGSTLEEESAFDPQTGRDVGRRTLHMTDGRVLSAQYFIRYYPRRELEQLLTECGFQVGWMEGGLEGEPVDEHSTELIVGARSNG